MIFELLRDKYSYLGFVPCEDLGKPVYPLSVIRVFTARLMGGTGP